MSNSSLYGSTGNVTVSANNLTTLYNSVPGATVTTQNVADRNFTTLYASRPADINPTKAYGNSNVEAFLNAGTDGANTVQNIIMTGNITVGGQSNLGSVSNVHIDGGQIHYVLTTDGGGGLTWEEPAGSAGNVIPYIHFDVSATANNQQFTDTNIERYSDVTSMNVMKNGINIEPSQYELYSANTVQINIPLATGDTIDILAQSSSGSGGVPGGNVYEVQYNNGIGGFDGNASFTFDQANSTLTVGNVSTGNILSNNITSNSLIINTTANTLDLNVTGESNLGSVGNVIITGGTANYVLSTDGAGNLSWVAQSGGGGNASSISNGTSNVKIATSNGNITMSVGGNANIVTISTSGTYLGANANVFITGGNSGEVLSTDGGGNLSWITAGAGSSLTGLTDANVVALGNNSANTATAGSVLIGDGANGTSSTVAIGKDADAPSTGIAIGTTSRAGGGGVTVGPYAGSTSGAYNITMGTGAGSGTSGDFNINIGVDTNSTLTGNNNVLFGRSATPSSSSVNGEITLGGSYTTNTRIPYGNLSVTGNASFGNMSGTITTASQTNITSLGNLTDLTVAGTTSIQQAKEKLTANGTGATGTINYDVLTQAIILQTANASANFTLNIRGDASTSFDSVVSTNQSMTITYINKNGTTGYYANVIQIDNTPVTPVWPGGQAPIGGTPYGYDMYNFNILKTAANTYVVFGVVGSYE